MSINDKLGHTVQRLKGHAEEDAGKALGDDDLVAHGKADQLAAHAKQAASQAKHAASQAGGAARHVGQSLTDRAMRRLGRLHERLHEAAAEEARVAREQEQREAREQEMAKREAQAAKS